MGRVKASKEIQVETWITRDRINRYRGVLKLHARDKKLQLSQAAKFKSIVSRKLASLETDVKRHHEITSDPFEDGKRRASQLLTSDKELCLAFKHLKPLQVCGVLYQDGEVKRRHLDKFYYEKQKRLKKMIELQLEHNDLSRDYEEQNDLPDCEQQRLVARLQRLITKHNTAKTIHYTYCSMLNIFKKDATFFDTMLNILREDQTSQCKTILRIIMMGQLAAENLDDIREKFKQITRIIWCNMKVREQMLNTVRCQVQDLWLYAQSLVRVESDTIFAKKDTDESFSDKFLEKQLTHLEDICNRMKETLLIPFYYDLLSRFESQTRQKTDLLARLNTNMSYRDSLLNKKNHVLQVLESLEHSTKSMAEQYKINGRDILEQIKIEKKRERDLKELKKTRGELLMNIGAALQSLYMALFCVKQNGKGGKKMVKNGNKSIPKELDDKEDTEEYDALLNLEEMNRDVLLLLSNISHKAITLFGMSNIDFDKSKEERAQDLYQTYVSNYNSNLMLKSGEEEPIELIVEHETIDVNVPTRADIKLYSRQMIEAHLKPE